MQAIDPVGSRIAGTLPQPQPAVTGYPAARATFVEPTLAAAATGRPAPPINKGARY